MLRPHSQQWWDWRLDPGVWLQGRCSEPPPLSWVIAEGLDDTHLLPALQICNFHSETGSWEARVTAPASDQTSGPLSGSSGSQPLQHLKFTWGGLVFISIDACATPAKEMEC